LEHSEKDSKISENWTDFLTISKTWEMK